MDAELEKTYQWAMKEGERYFTNFLNDAGIFHSAAKRDVRSEYKNYYFVISTRCLKTKKEVVDTVTNFFNRINDYRRKIHLPLETFNKE